MTGLLRLIFSGITVLSALAFLGLAIFLHFFQNKYNPIKNTVSDYAVAPSGKLHAFMVTAMPLTGAVSGPSLAVAIAVSVNTVFIYAVWFLVIASICRFILIFFPTDITGQPITKIGRVHLIFAVIAFAGIAFAAGNFHMTAMDGVLGQVVVITAILLLLGFFISPFKKIFGLLERIFLLSSVIWLVVVGFSCF